MAEFVEKTGLLCALAEVMQNPWSDYDDLYDVAENSPAADVSSVVHGRWIARTGRAACSVCADECWADSALEYRYCPTCGAKMDGERQGVDG